MQVSNIHMDDHSIVVGAKNTHTFGITDNAAFLHNLSDTLYSDKLLAAIREPMCNAWDAHTDAGIRDTPILVTLTPSYIEVKDFGKGISKEDFPTIYGVYGGSTKQTDNSQTGGFGLGCKAPFAYTDTFTVTSIYNEVKTIYSLNKISVAGGKPAISEILSIPTTEPSGLTVQIPLKETDSICSKELKEILEVISYTVLGSEQSVNLVIDYEHIKFNEELSAPTLKFSDSLRYAKYEFNPENFTLRATTEEILQVLGSNTKANNTSGHCNVLISYANVLYPLQLETLPAETMHVIQSMYSSYSCKLRSTYTASGIFIIKAEPGTLAITPSRESLSYNNTTLDNLNDLITNKVWKEFSDVSDRVAEVYAAAMDAVLTERATADSIVHNSLFNRGCNSLRDMFNKKAEELYVDEELVNTLLDTHMLGLTPVMYTTRVFSGMSSSYWDSKFKMLRGVYIKHLNRIAEWTKKDITYGKLRAALTWPLRKHGILNSFYYLEDIRRSTKVDYILDNRYNIGSNKELILKDNIINVICPESMCILVSRTKKYIQQEYKNINIPVKSAALVLTAKQYESKEEIFGDLTKAGYFIIDITENELEYKEILRSEGVSVSGSATDASNLNFATSVKNALIDKSTLVGINTVSRLEPITIVPKYVWEVENGAIKTGHLTSGIYLSAGEHSPAMNVIDFVLKDLEDDEDAAFVSTEARANKLKEEYNIPDMSTYFKEKYVLPYLSDENNLINLFSELMCAPIRSKGNLLDSIRYAARAINSENILATLIYKSNTLNDLLNRDGLYNSIKMLNSSHDEAFSWIESVAPNVLNKVIKPFYEEPMEGNDTIINIINLLLSNEDKNEVYNFIVNNISGAYVNVEFVKEFEKLGALFFMIKNYFSWGETSYWDASRLDRVIESDRDFLQDSLTTLHSMRSKFIKQFIEEIKNV